MGISAFISGIFNIVFLAFQIRGLMVDGSNGIYSTIFLIVFSSWQLTNIGLAIYCAVDQESAPQFKLYFKLNQYIVGGFTALFIVIDIMIWISGMCSGEYCPIVDIICMCILAVILMVGISGFMVVYMAYKLCESTSSAEFKVMHYAEQKDQYKL
jgi:hypothetical protein